jgi:hypothetical protein
MSPLKIKGVVSILIALFLVDVRPGNAQKSSGFTPHIPKTWDDAVMPTLEVPLADPAGSPKHVSADYYYKIPVRPIYKQYQVYAPGHEPPGYWDSLQQKEPEILWDDKGHRPPLNTREDWIKAGEMVFDASPTTEAVLRFRRQEAPSDGPRRARRPRRTARCPVMVT